MLNNDKKQDGSSDNTPSRMNGEVSDSTPSQMNGDVSDSTPSRMRDEQADAEKQADTDEEAGADEVHGADSQIPDSGLIEETEPTIERPKADYQLLYTTAYHQIYSIVGEGRRYILKAIKPSAGDRKRQENLLKREYTLLSQLECPYIVRVWKLRNDPKVGLAIVMEYVDGQPLDKWLKTKPSQAQRQQILSELLEAIQYLHNKQIVHGDLKPQNILVASNHVKLLDVGFSDKDEFTQNNIGYTPGYAAPEQTAGGTTDSRTDIYAIGALIRLLFPHKYLWVVRRCMRPNPQKRYASVADIQQAMQRKTLKWTLVLLSVGIVGMSIFVQNKYENTDTAINTDSIAQGERTATDTITSIAFPTSTTAQNDTNNTSLDNISKAEKPTKTTKGVTTHKTGTDNTKSNTVIAEPPVSYEYLYDSLVACYNLPRGSHYAKGKAPYKEFLEVWADFFEAEVRDLTYHYLKQYPSKEGDVRGCIGRLFIGEYMIYRNLLRYYYKNTKQICDYPNDTINQRKLKYLQDSLAVYSKYVDSFFSDADFVRFMPSIQVRRDDDKRNEENKQKRKEMKAKMQQIQEKERELQSTQPY